VMRRAIMHISKCSVGVVGVVFLMTLGTARAQNTVYDDFTSNDLNADLWTSQQSGSGGLDSIRQVLFGKLVMSHRVVGNTSTSTGQQVSRNDLRFRNGSGINTIIFHLKVKDFSVVGCAAAGSNTSRSLAGFFSALFNDGSSTGLEDQTGDIGAFVFLHRSSDSTDPSNLLRVEAGLVRCAGAGCTPAEDIGLLDLGTVRKRENVQLGLSWVAAEQRVLFQKNDEPIQFVTYHQPVVTTRGFRVLEVRGEAANCNSGSERPSAKITAVFDTIVVNP
jgi:hypothetical protein